MAECAEQNPSIGVVGAYVLSGNTAEAHVKCDGIDPRCTLVSGCEAVRGHLLGTHAVLGVPTGVLYRADLVRRDDNFYPNSRAHADVSVFYECLYATNLVLFIRY